MNLNLRLSVLAMISASLIGCASNAPTQAPAAPATPPAAAQPAVKPLAGVTLSGIAGAGQQKFTVTVYDAQGNR